MAKSLKLKNNQYWDINSIIVDKTTLRTYLSSTYLGKNGGYTFRTTGKTGDDSSNGYRLVFSCKIEAWGHVREVWQVASRHLGTGFYIIENSLGSTIANYSAETKYYGGTISLTSDSLITYYNGSDGMFRVFMHYTDFSPIYVRRLAPYDSGVSSVQCGSLTWYDTIPSGIGDKITLTKV